MEKIQVDIDELLERLNDIKDEDDEFTRVELTIESSRSGDAELSIEAIDMMTGNKYDFGKISGETED